MTCMVEGCILPASRFLANRDFAHHVPLSRAGIEALKRGEYAELCASCHREATSTAEPREPAWTREAP